MEGVHVAIGSEPTSVVPPRADPVNVLQWFLCSCKSIPCYRKQSTAQHDAATVCHTVYEAQTSDNCTLLQRKTGTVNTVVLQARYDSFVSFYFSILLPFKAALQNRQGRVEHKFCRIELSEQFTT